MTGDGAVQRRDGGAGIRTAGCGAGSVASRGVGRRHRVAHLRPFEFHFGLPRGEHRRHFETGDDIDDVQLKPAFEFPGMDESLKNPARTTKRSHLNDQKIPLMTMTQG